MSHHDVSRLLDDIHQALTKALRWAHPLSYNTFCEDDLQQSAIIRQLEIAGEAASKIPETYRLAHPDLA